MLRRIFWLSGYLGETETYWSIKNKVASEKAVIERWNIWHFQVAAEGIILTEAQLKELEKQKSKREALGEIETEYPGFLGAQNTYYIGNFKGIGMVADYSIPK
jgi:hypothetical protein